MGRIISSFFSGDKVEIVVKKKISWEKNQKAIKEIDFRLIFGKRQVSDGERIINTNLFTELRLHCGSMELLLFVGKEIHF